MGQKRGKKARGKGPAKGIDFQIIVIVCIVDSCIVLTFVPTFFSTGNNNQADDDNEVGSNLH
jgi:hypothetical protein